MCYNNKTHFNLFNIVNNKQLIMSIIKPNEVLLSELHLSGERFMNVSKTDNSSIDDFDSLSKLQSFTSNNQFTRMANSSLSLNALTNISFTSKVTNKTIQTLKIQFKLLFPIPYPQSFFDKVYSNEYKTIIAFDKPTKELYGFCIMDIDNKKATIISIGVVKEFQNKKIGSALLQKSIEEVTLLGVKEINLIVQINNHIAIKLYKKFGFYEYRTIKDYYNVLEDERDGVEMVLSIKKEGKKKWIRNFIGCYLCMRRDKL